MATTLKQAVEVAEEVSTMPSWVRKALSANDAYSLPEKRIPAFSVALKPPDVADEVARTRGHNWHDCHAPFPSISGPGPASLRFHKGSLLHARVISQVDRKFVACCIPTTKEGSEQEFTGSRPSDDQTPQETIVLIDQHAADERVRVERFLKDLCMGYLCPIGGGGSDTGVKTRLLSPASLVLLTHHEARQLSTSEPIQAEFRRWGFEFASLSGAYLPQAGTDTASTESGYVQVEVQSVPDMVADKLLQGYELRDLIKAFIARLADEVGGDSECLMQEGSQNDLPWLMALRKCPRELVDLVNSKACRGKSRYPKRRIHRITKNLD
ncbi:hypothetical protein ONZ45_g4120 [Pleurotus djamor]|nr:hypothetical protein ONZ45_g4120 [Pleurotus djamor]